MHDYHDDNTIGLFICFTESSVLVYFFRQIADFSDVLWYLNRTFGTLPEKQMNRLIVLWCAQTEYDIVRHQEATFQAAEGKVRQIQKS